MKKKTTAPETYQEHKQFEFDNLKQAGIDGATAKRVTSIMHELGVPAGVSGHTYIRAAVCLAVQYKGDDYFIRNGFFGELMHNTAALCGSTYTRVDRGMRHAIDLAWTRGNIELQQKYFGWTVNTNTYMPTCSEFVATVADVIRMEACYHD